LRVIEFFSEKRADIFPKNYSQFKGRAKARIENAKNLRMCFKRTKISFEKAGLKPAPANASCGRGNTGLLSMRQISAPAPVCETRY
jgi:hypothetical protein